MPAKSRPLSAMSSMLSRVITAERAPLVVCTCTRFGLHRHGLRQSADVERDRAQPEAFGRTEHDALLLVGLEPLHGDGQVERARQQVGKQKRAIGPGHGFAREAGPDVPDRLTVTPGSTPPVASVTVPEI